ncbi:putative N-acetyltransferase [Cafeteria roenbergensis virus]|uniref:Putative N-acetyltransferase n=1 Tax=Cafeteria roenbergensis virus (strain BV-PW1) TaxID=693272 RepID=E3T5G3_CROVB|nr:putative N-acetyltransferase [Cafeteria roenbergensis virus BV-PW1]ADO67426.1 putative N-acetyltransferase [Cafeteria roenbergensis virus BV-PW1]
MIILELNKTVDLNQYLKLISQLKETNITIDKLKLILNNLPNNHKIYIALINNMIVGSITFILEQKIIHNGKFVLHIEDLIVSKEVRGCGIASKLLDYSKNYAKNNNCYKIILDCDNKIKNFYKKNNFKEKNIQMSLYL